MTSDAQAQDILAGNRRAPGLEEAPGGVRLAAAQQMLVGLLLVVLMIKRPEGLLPEVLGDGHATPAGRGPTAGVRPVR